MQKKTIKKALNGICSKLIDSITDPVVKDLVRKNTIITGGSIASMLLGEDVNDYDIYFTNKTTVLAVAEYYVKQLKERSGESVDVLEDELDPDRIKIFIKSSGCAKISYSEEEKPKFRPIFFSSNAITLSDKVQIIIRFYGDPETIHKNYDFIHATNYWTSDKNKLVLRQEALERLLSKHLYYCGSKYPLCSVIRTRKFIKRGWHINAGQYLKMLFQVSRLDLTDIKVLEDQLFGVDTAYFDTLITALRKHSEKNPDFEITDGYLCSLIDKIFGDV